MSSLIEEFWIFSKDGEPLVHFKKISDENNKFYYTNPEIEPQVLTEMRNIILERSKDLNKKQNYVEINDNHFNFAQCLQNDSIIFYKTIDGAKKKKIQNVCGAVSKIFEESYKLNQLKFAEENLHVFEKFDKKIRLYFKMSEL